MSAFAASGRAFGRFQRLLQGYPAHTLYETIPHFHDTEDRLAKLKAAAAADPLGPLGIQFEEMQVQADLVQVPLVLGAVVGPEADGVALPLCGGHRLL